MNTNPVEEPFTNFTGTVLDHLAAKYPDFLCGFFLALVVCWAYNRYLGYYFLKKSHREILNAKNETISTLRQIVYERLDKIKSDKDNKGILKGLRKYFRKKVI